MDAAQSAAAQLAKQLPREGEFLPFVMALSSDGLHVLTLDVTGETTDEDIALQFDEAVYHFLVRVQAEAVAVLDSCDRVRVDPNDELAERRAERMALGEFPDSQEVVLIEACDGQHALQSQAALNRRTKKVTLDDWETYRVDPTSHYSEFVSSAIDVVKGLN